MDLKNKNVLVLGLGISGVSTIKALDKLGAEITVSDIKQQQDLKDYIAQIEQLKLEFFLGTNDVPLDNIDLIIKSPGIPLNIEIIEKANRMGIEVITDIELAFRIAKYNNIIAITGTNGKTTTTALVGQFFKAAKYNTHVVGNIGVGFLWDFVNSDIDDIFIVEASSFQLKSTLMFKPKISLMLNISPDHLDWHDDFNDYIQSKKRIFINQTKKEYAILNYDDRLLRNFKNEINSNLVWFSVDNRLSKGIYVDDEYVVIKNNEKFDRVIKVSEIKMLGKHNLQNALAGIAIGWVMGLDTQIMRKVLRTFPGVEHRIEFVDNINGIKFYNDSKGTNPEASIRAIEAVNPPIILIAGGYDKNSLYDDFILSFNDRVKALVLLGETKEKIHNTAIKYGFKNIHIVNTIKEAVMKSFSLAKNGDSVLLSPACASWDMYGSYEIRGYDFKNNVYSLREE